MHAEKGQVGGGLVGEGKAIPPPQNEMITEYIPKEEERNAKQR